MAINGLVVMTPTSVAKTGASSTATINADGSVTFGSCETLSLNGVFTSDYDNYMISIKDTSTAEAARLDVRLRGSGTDANAANYTFQRLLADGTTVNGARDSSQTSARISSLGGSTTSGALTLYIYGPNLAQPTAMRSVTVESYLGGRMLDYASTHSLSTAYDGITVIAAIGGSGAMTGTVTVYGFNQ